VQLPVRAKGCEIEPLEQERKLPQAYFHHLLFRFRPAEPLLLQSFLEKTEPVPVPVEDLYGRSSSVAENEQMPEKGSSSSTASTRIESPLIPFRMSVLPKARWTRVC